MVTSGIRIGTPSVTTRKMKEPQMQKIAELIDRAILGRDDPSKKEGVKQEVIQLTKQFPIYENL